MLTNSEKMTKLANDLSVELSVTPPDSPLRWDSKELVPLVEFVIARLANDAPPALPDEPDLTLLRRIAALALVWPAHDEDNCPAEILYPIRNYYKSILRAHRGK